MTSHERLLERATSPIRVIPTAIVEARSIHQNMSRQEYPELSDTTTEESDDEPAEDFSPEEDAKLLALVMRECSPEFW